MNAAMKVVSRRKLTLIEVSILIGLEKEYPKYTPIDKLTTSEDEYIVIKKSLIQMIEKRLVEQRWEKYRIIKGNI